MCRRPNASTVDPCGAVPIDDAARLARAFANGKPNIRRLGQRRADDVGSDEALA